MDYKTKQYRAKQVLYRAARWLLGDGNGDQSRWARGQMFEDDLGMEIDWRGAEPDCGHCGGEGCRCCFPSGACALGSIHIAVELLFPGSLNELGEDLSDFAAEELRNYLKYEHPFGKLEPWRIVEVSRFNDEYAERAEDVASALKAAAGPPRR